MIANLAVRKRALPGRTPQKTHEKIAYVGGGAIFEGPGNRPRERRETKARVVLAQRPYAQAKK